MSIMSLKAYRQPATARVPALINGILGAMLALATHEAGFLESSYAIRRARRFDIRGKRHLEVQDKFYLGDIGLRYARLASREGDVAAVLENVVFLELLARGFSVSVGKIGAHEVDFIAASQGSRAYIQVCTRLDLPETRERELRPLRSIPAWQAAQRCQAYRSGMASRGPDRHFQHHR